MLARRTPFRPHANGQVVAEATQLGYSGFARSAGSTNLGELSHAGVEIEKISEAMGHSNSTVTQVLYRHSLADKVSDAARVMDTMWGS